MYLKMAKQSNTTSWEEEACDEPTNPPKLKPPKVTFRKEVTVIPTTSDQQGPKRAVKEIANLKSSQIVSKDGPPARNTRSRFAAAATALAAMASITQADGHQWEHRNHTTMPIKLELNEIANAVLEGDKVLKYRQLIQHPVIGEQWRHSSANEFGRLAQGIGGRVKGTDTVKFIPKHQVPYERMKDVTMVNLILMYSILFSGVCRYKFLISPVMNLAFLVEITLLKRILAKSMSAVGVPTSPG